MGSLTGGRLTGATAADRLLLDVDGVTLPA